MIIEQRAGLAHGMGYTEGTGNANDVSAQTIGQYPVIRAIARGGAAEVFEVECPQTQQRMALKRLNLSGTARDRFEREFRALKSLDHDSVVTVFDQGEDEEGRQFILMELLEGKTVNAWIRRAGDPGSAARNQEAVRIVRTIADALHALHDEGIIHRDIKSDNVLVLEDGTLRLLDFGSAIAEGVCGGITNPGEFIGTFAYAAPEQILGEAVDGRIDVYALGVLFYRLLTGKMPFTAENRYRLAQQHLRETPRAPSEVRAGIPTAVSSLVMDMLTKDPSVRPSAAAVCQRLDGRIPVDSPEALYQQLAGLRPVARRLMQALAVAGEPVDEETLGHMTDLSLEQTRNLLADLESQNWLKRARDTWFFHDFRVGEQLVNGVREARRYLLKSRLQEFRRVLTSSIC